MTETRTARVFRLRIVPPPQRRLEETTEGEHVAQAFVAGRRVTRYSRVWLVGQTEVANGALAGRIGFYSESESILEVWDEEKNDFATFAANLGVTMPFVVNLTSLMLLVQLRGQAVKLNGLIGAMEAMLDESSQQRGWKIIATGHRMTRQEWLELVDRVTEIRLVTRQPNPRWMGAPDLQKVMDESRAQTARLTLAAQEGLNPESDFLQQTLLHVDRGYGEGTLSGVRKDGKPSTWSTKLQAEEVPEAFPVLESGEVSQDALLKAALVDPQTSTKE